jgi:hypothetical protein
MGTNYFAIVNTPKYATRIHLGKKSVGWSFLFHLDVKHNFYHDFESFHKFIMSDATLVLDEYDETIDKKEFIGMILDSYILYGPKHYEYVQKNHFGRHTVQLIDEMCFDSAEFC